MIKYYRLYLKHTNKYINLEVYVNNNTTSSDVLYLLDGQNSFRDYHTLYGRSLRLEKVLNKINESHPLIAVGIPSDSKRNDEYAPFEIVNTTLSELKNNDLEYNKKFTLDLIETIIPFIDNKFNINNRFIYGSSLAATYALYLGTTYKNLFSYVGAFSTASFIYDGFNKYILDNLNKSLNIYLYVGGNEESDNDFSKDDYLNTSVELYRLFKDNNINCRLDINKKGRHSEKYWSYYLPDFIKFIYEKH